MKYKVTADGPPIRPAYPYIGKYTNGYGHTNIVLFTAPKTGIYLAGGVETILMGQTSNGFSEDLFTPVNNVTITAA